MTLPRLSILVAMARNRVIGRNNALPWHLPADLKHFKSLTMGHSIIMGRKTYESIGKPLAGRTNIIITHQAGYEAPGAMIVHSVEEAILACKEATQFDGENFVIGGEKLFQQTIMLCQRMYLTEIHKDFEGDTFFPQFDRNDWEEVKREKYFDDSGGKLEYHFIVLDRKP
ncbi:MAG: dihydrofolate reductase [Nitrosomonas sp.]|nr:MAG: dihydrofolate reductase [Nitrosomonas sp.]